MLVNPGFAVICNVVYFVKGSGCFLSVKARVYFPPSNVETFQPAFLPASSAERARSICAISSRPHDITHGRVVATGRRMSHAACSANLLSHKAETLGLWCSSDANIKDGANKQRLHLSLLNMCSRRCQGFNCQKSYACFLYRSYFKFSFLACSSDLTKESIKSWVWTSHVHIQISWVHLEVVGAIRSLGKREVFLHCPSSGLNPQLSLLQSSCLTTILVTSLRLRAGGILPWLHTFDEGYTASRAESKHLKVPALKCSFPPAPSPFPASFPASPWPALQGAGLPRQPCRSLSKPYSFGFALAHTFFFAVKVPVSISLSFKDQHKCSLLSGFSLTISLRWELCQLCSDGFCSRPCPQNTVLCVCLAHADTLQLFGAGAVSISCFHPQN